MGSGQGLGFGWNRENECSNYTLEWGFLGELEVFVKGLTGEEGDSDGFNEGWVIGKPGHPAQLV